MLEVLYSPCTRQSEVASAAQKYAPGSFKRRFTRPRIFTGLWYVWHEKGLPLLDHRGPNQIKTKLDLTRCARPRPTHTHGRTHFRFAAGACWWCCCRCWFWWWETPRIALFREKISSSSPRIFSYFIESLLAVSGRGVENSRGVAWRVISRKSSPLPLMLRGFKKKFSPAALCVVIKGQVREKSPSSKNSK